MSLTQTLIVLFIGLFVIKPDDIPMLINQIKKIKSYFSNVASSEVEQLNFYIQKIISIEGYYDGDYNGDYNLVAIKEKYNKLIKSVINNDLNNINE
ncbi:DUF2672 domain-containing protein [Rickettsia endosymbiont of Lasioglossum villosulum]|uniref:DUF2672 domain-containing protein n=1 Tax=Rickettsia endosymbiont of Lasioglossum villosulum TaxID=3066269 RepID=UPI003132F025